MRKQNDSGDIKSQNCTSESPWRTVKRTIKPLKNNKINKVVKGVKADAIKTQKPVIKSPKPVKTPLSQTEFEKLLHRWDISPPLFDTFDIGPPASDVIIGDTSRINRSHSRRLKAGNIPIDSVLDLHGCTQQQAYLQMHGFLTHALLRGHRQVKIITGKGKGILKNALPEWINNSEFKHHVLAIDFARPEHGGTGAYYIVLKKR